MCVFVPRSKHINTFVSASHNHGSAPASQFVGAWAAPRRTGAGDSDTYTMDSMLVVLWKWCITCRGAAHITDSSRQCDEVLRPLPQSFRLMLYFSWSAIPKHGTGDDVVCKSHVYLPCGTIGTALPSLTCRGWRVGRQNFWYSLVYYVHTCSQLRPPRATAAQSGGAWAAPDDRTAAGESDPNTIKGG